MNSTRATSEAGWARSRPATGRAPEGIGERDGIRDRLGPELEDQRRVDLAQRTRDVGRAEGVEDRRRHGPEAPAGPGQDGGGQAVGDLPGHGVTPADPPLPQPAGDGGHQGSAWAPSQPGVAVDDLAAVGRVEVVERRHVPGPAGPSVGRAWSRHPGRSEAGRHGRAPYPGPGNVTPMSERSPERVWTSR